ncbi:MAG: hypothetical protein ACRCT8_12135 [Lacipirellulaceae bacterium]
MERVEGYDREGWSQAEAVCRTVAATSGQTIPATGDPWGEDNEE